MLDHVAAGGVKDDYLSSLASRLARIDKQCDHDDKTLIADTSGGVSLASISAALVAALDADRQDEAVRQMFHISATDTPTVEQIAKAAAPLKKAAIKRMRGWLLMTLVVSCGSDPCHRISEAPVCLMEM